MNLKFTLGFAAALLIFVGLVTDERGQLARIADKKSIIQKTSKDRRENVYKRPKEQYAGNQSFELSSDRTSYWLIDQSEQASQEMDGVSRPCKTLTNCSY